MTFHANLSRVFLNDAVGDGESQAGAPGLAFAGRSLGGKEWIVDALNVLRGDARPGVSYADANALTIQSGHPQRATAGHGVFGVHEQVQEHFLQSSRVSLNARQLRRNRILHLTLSHLY